MTNNLSVVINSDAQQVWTMLREPAKVAQWHGWEADDLAAEINEIYFSTNVVEGADHTTLMVDGGDVFTLKPVSAGTEVSVTRAALDHNSEWAAWDEDITQGWLTFLQQLRFALERHPHGKRRTLLLLGSRRRRLRDRQAGPRRRPRARRTVFADPGHRRGDLRQGLVPQQPPGGAHGPQLRRARRRPADRGGPAAHRRGPARRRVHGDRLHLRSGGPPAGGNPQHWDSWRAENYPTSDPVH